MADSYVCSKAKIRCSCGDKISTLTVLPDRTIWLTGQPQANISDHIPLRNIAPFGKCHTVVFPATGAATAAAHGKLTPMPCVPNTPFPWMGGKNDVLLQGLPALLKSSTCCCVYGGTITFSYDGQIEGTNDDLEKESPQSQEELDASTETSLSPEELLDAIQMALDAAGLFPGLGAIPDILNACISACRGDWTNAALCLLAAIPGIGDAAGAAKLMKNGAKMAKKTKKMQKAAGQIDDVAKARAKKEAAAQRERLIQEGVAEGKVIRFERKAEVVTQKEGTTGRSVEITQHVSISKTETRASVDPVNPVRSTGNQGNPSQTFQNQARGGRSGGQPASNKSESIFESNKNNKSRDNDDVVDITEKLEVARKKADEVRAKGKPPFGI